MFHFKISTETMAYLSQLCHDMQEIVLKENVAISALLPLLLYSRVTYHMEKCCLCFTVKSEYLRLFQNKIRIIQNNSDEKFEQ
jgi:hypothetical protein